MGASPSTATACNCSDDAVARVVEHIPGPIKGISKCCNKDDIEANIVVDVPMYEGADDHNFQMYDSRSDQMRGRQPRQLQRPGGPTAGVTYNEGFQQQSDPRVGLQPQQQTMDSRSSPQVPVFPQRRPSLDDIQVMEQFGGQKARAAPGLAAQGGEDGQPPNTFELATASRTQCCCFPSTDLKPQEEEMVKNRFWCCYCCCAGLGTRCSLDPLMYRYSCGCCHCSWESADVVDKLTGICSTMMNCCCCAGCLCHYPLPKGTPYCVCCNEKCCYKGGRDAAMRAAIQSSSDSQFDVDLPSQRKRRTSVTSVQEFEETSHVLKNQIIPCFCCCCGCTEDYGKNLCGYNTKCCCCRCDGRWGLPFYTGCKILSLCCGSYFQCRCPRYSEAHTCVCCGLACDSCSLSACYFAACPRRCPRFCETLKCCSCSQLCGECCMWNPCWHRCCRCCHCC